MTRFCSSVGNEKIEHDKCSVRATDIGPVIASARYSIDGWTRGHKIASLRTAWHLHRVVVRKSFVEVGALSTFPTMGRITVGVSHTIQKNEIRESQQVFAFTEEVAGWCVSLLQVMVPY